MAKVGKLTLGAVGGVVQSTPKKTSTSGKPHMVKTSSMNKHKRRSYKKYRGQGR